MSFETEYLIVASAIDNETVEKVWKTLQPRRLDEVFGRSAVVRALTSRVEWKAHAVPIILYGPTGVGKLTLARLYAKAILCETDTSDGSSCNRCGTCIAFDNGQYEWSYIEQSTFNFALAQKPNSIDAYRKALSVWAHKLQKKLMSSSIGTSQLVIVMGQIDRFPAEAFDILLKAIEDLTDKSVRKTTSVRVILLAEDINRVRRAGRSRCFDYRLRQLNDSESRVLFSSLMTYTSLRSDERALDMLVQATSGIPGEIKRLFSIVASTGEISVESVTMALELDWVNDTARYISALFTDQHIEGEALRPKEGVSLTVQVRRIKSLLYSIQPRLNQVSIGGMAHHDTALMFGARESLNALSVRLNSCANTQGKDVATLWRELATLWINHEITDAVSLSEIGRRTKLLVSQ